MKKTAKLLVAISMLTLATYTNAQVTIGYGKKAVPGALLQLKENDNLDANATKGLLLPRLQLTAHNLDSIKTASTDTPDMYAGLTVWNIRGVDDICKGVQVWNGSKWISPMPKPKDLTDYNPATGILTDHEGNQYTTADFGEAGRWMTVNLRSTRAPHSCDDVYFPGELSDYDFAYRMEKKIMLYPNGPVTMTVNTPPATWTPEQGMLYSWSLATNGKGGVDGKGNVDNPAGNINESAAGQYKDRQGICPDGWHLPSRAEWAKLYEVLHADATGTSPSQYADYTSQTRGGATSAKSKTALTATATNGASKPASEGGFNALFTGAATDETKDYGEKANFWTASGHDLIFTDAGGAIAAFACFTELKPSTTSGIDKPAAPILFSNGRRSHLFSVRCIQNK